MRHAACGLRFRLFEGRKPRATEAACAVSAYGNGCWVSMTAPSSRASTGTRDADGVVARVRPRRPAKPRCGRCERRAPRYDQGDGERSWRGLDLGTVRVWLVADAPRVACPAHGVTVIAGAVGPTTLVIQLPASADTRRMRPARANRSPSSSRGPAGWTAAMVSRPPAAGHAPATTPPHAPGTGGRGGWPRGRARTAPPAS